MFGTDTFLANYARTAKDGDFSSLRFVVAGAEAVKPETRRVYRERFQAEIIEGFGLTEAAPVVAVNTAIHGRDGTVGRLLPAMACMNFSTAKTSSNGSSTVERGTITGTSNLGFDRCTEAGDEPPIGFLEIFLDLREKNPNIQILP